MICVSLGGLSVTECLALLEEIEFAEIRLDTMDVTREDVKRIFSVPRSLIATCRPGNLHDQARKDLLIAAIDHGAQYVDIEVESDSGFRHEIMAKARSGACRTIVSFHDFDKTPGEEELERIVRLCFSEGADIAKIACKVNSMGDNVRLLGLLNGNQGAERIVPVGMGSRGKITRIIAPLLGSPFTFASPDKGKETAEGQMDRHTMERVIRLLNDV
jgi:3-dehydroquinate dehydratase I